MSLTDQLAQIKSSINEAETELGLLNSGRKVSSARLRKQLQNVKQQSQILRKSVIEHTKSMPTKKRVIKEKKVEFVEPMPELEKTQLEKEPTKKRVLKKKQPVQTVQ